MSLGIRSKLICICFIYEAFTHSLLPCFQNHACPCRPDHEGNPKSKKVEGKPITYYHVLVDSRDLPYSVSAPRNLPFWLV